MTRLLAVLALVVAAVGLGGCPATVPHEPLMLSADVPRIDLPAECDPGADAAEPSPPAGGIPDVSTAAREHRKALLWGRDLKGSRRVCWAWWSAYVAARWPAEKAKPGPQRIARLEP